MKDNASKIYEWDIRGQNNAGSSNMTEQICHFIGHKCSQFQALSGHFLNKQLKIIQFPFRFQGNLSTK